MKQSISGPGKVSITKVESTTGHKIEILATLPGLTMKGRAKIVMTPEQFAMAVVGLDNCIADVSVHTEER